MCLTEELGTKALPMHDWKVLNKVTVGDLVVNELKYHATCLVICRWRFKTDRPTTGTKTWHQDTCNKAIEEVLTMIIIVIDEDISAGRTCFLLKDEETCQRKRHFGDDTNPNHNPNSNPNRSERTLTHLDDT